MNIVLIHNPKSGSALSESELRHKVKAAGLEIVTLLVINDALEKKLKRYIRKDMVIAAIGGDGTLSAVASILAGKSAIFAPLPGGTLNHFTKDLGIPQDIDEALRGLAGSRTHSIDIANVNDRVFINNSSIGLYPSSLHTRSHFEDHLGKWPAAVIASIHTLLWFRPYMVTIDGETFHTPFIFVGNNDYSFEGLGGPVRTALDKGVLSVFVARTATRWVLMKIALAALIGRAKELDEFDVYHVTQFTIKAHKKHLSVSCDGEVTRMSSPLRYEIKPTSLRVRF